MKILITGGAGYIGNVLTRELLKNNFKVTIIDNFGYNQQSSLLSISKNENLEIIKSDVRNLDILNNEIKKHDVVIPLAAVVGAPACDLNPKLASEINLDQIKNIKKIIHKDQIILLPVTNSGYGIGKKDIYCDETSDLNPISHYGKTKVESEKVISDLENFVSLRLATVFGVSSRMRVDLLVNDFVYKACTDKYLVLFESHFKRNFIHIDDIAFLMKKILLNFNDFKGNIFNVGIEDANLSKKELCEKIKEYLPKTLIIENEFNKDPDQRNYIVSNKKIYSKGWKPERSIDYGIQELIKCYNFFERNDYKNI
jgi:nucleoside-diphosphate-sugar epimerase